MQTLFAAEEVFHSETAKVTISQTEDENDLILSVSPNESFAVCKKMTWKGRGSLHDLLIHHLSLCVGEAKTGGCSSAKIWELMLTVVGKQVHVPDLYHQGCTLCT